MAGAGSGVPRSAALRAASSVRMRSMSEGTRVVLDHDLLRVRRGGLHGGRAIRREQVIGEEKQAGEHGAHDHEIAKQARHWHCGIAV